MTQSQKALWGALAIVVLAVSSCGHVAGMVSTVAYSGPPQGASFTVIMPDPPSLTDKNIGALISKEMTVRGFVPAANADRADLRIRYSYTFSAGKHGIAGSPTTGHYTVTSYPRHFDVKIVASHEVVWEAEIYSQGSSHNISWLAETFIPELFEHFNSSVANERFRKYLMAP